jgi:hypothetical protein
MFVKGDKGTKCLGPELAMCKESRRASARMDFLSGDFVGQIRFFLFHFFNRSAIREYFCLGQRVGRQRFHAVCVAIAIWREDELAWDVL